MLNRIKTYHLLIFALSLQALFTTLYIKGVVTSLFISLLPIALTLFIITLVLVAFVLFYKFIENDKENNDTKKRGN